MDRAAALVLVYQAIDIVNGLRPAGEQLPKSPDVILTGDQGLLDSLALTTLVLSLERIVRESTGRDVDLLRDSGPDDELVMLRSPAALADMILELVAE
jgi:hypothetical protein